MPAAMHDGRSNCHAPRKIGMARKDAAKHAPTIFLPVRSPKITGIVATLSARSPSTSLMS